MPAVVIDTNVIVVANNKSEHAGLNCFNACVNALETAKNRRTVLVDSGMTILDEYRRHGCLSGQPGLGDAFIKWLWNNQGNTRFCKHIDITPKVDDDEDFEEFPNDPDLTGFDRSDRKFVAVALASSCNPKILNATDSDWWNYRGHLVRHGVIIDFLCPDLVC